MNSYSLIANVKKIAVLRAISLGDFLIALPALQSLRASYPQAYITLLCRKWNEEFVRGRDIGINEAVAIPESKGVNDPKGFKEDRQRMKEFFLKMQKEKFDIAIQLHGGGRYSNPFIKKLGAKLTVGMRTRDAPKLDRTISYVFYQHEIFRYLEVMSLIGVKPVTIDPQLTVLKEDIEEAKRVYPQNGKPFVILHPGASDPRRRWDEHKFAHVADELSKSGFKIVITGIMEEMKIIQRVQKYMKQKATVLAEKLTLKGLTGLLSLAKLVISNDTGPLHLARAVGTPTVGIYWFPNLVNWGPVTRNKHRTASSYIFSCERCGFNLMKDEFTLNYQHPDCGHMDSVVRNVNVKEVLFKSYELLLQ